MSRTSVRRCATALVATCGLIGSAAASAGAIGVSPATHSQSADPGDVIHVTKTVSTPEIPPMPDIVLLADRTGSMGSAIANVKANMTDIVTTVQGSQPQAQFAVASYCDFDDFTGVPAFELQSDLSGNVATVAAAVNAITLCDGGDAPESQLNALWEIGSGGNAVSYRADSSRIVVWFGDQPGHDPSGGHTEADALAALQAVEARVVAVSVGANLLDSTGQATRLTDATGGDLLSGVGANEVSAAILEGLGNLPVEVGATPTCDTGLSVSLTPATQTVTSGDNAVFDETITVAADAPQGTTLECEVSFSLNGSPGGPEFVQTVTIDVNDVTPPTVSCTPGPNPAGHEPAADNQDGFYEMTASDLVDPSVDVYIHDDGSSAVFGPYPSGTTFKLTQAPGATPIVRPGTGDVDYWVKLRGDALLVAVDDAGNTATASCLVPPPPA